MGGGLQTYIDKVLGYGPIAYWPLNESSGTVAQCLVNPAQNGTYNSDVSGWPPGTGIGDGNTAPFFDGANDFINIYSATLAAAFNGAAGTVACWAKVVNVGAWTDTVTRKTVTLRVDGSNFVYCPHKKNTNNTYLAQYNAAGTLEAVQTAGHTDVTWMHLAMTWDKAAEQMKAFKSGSQEGATQVALGIWAGALSATQTVIGARNTAISDPWHGWIQHPGVWDTVLTQPQIADLATA